MTMTRVRWAIGAAVLAGLVLPVAAQDDKTYDLRGPAPTKDQTFVSKTTFKIKGGNVVIKAGGTTLDAKQTLTAVSEEETKVLAVDGRQITKVRTRVTKDRTETVTTFSGEDTKEDKAGELHGEVIVSERTGPGKWKHSLVDNKPTDAQKKELDKRVGPENDDDLYPAEKVKVGHTWEVDATALQRVFGGSITDLKGKLQMKLVKIEAVGGEDCAVVESEGKITGVAKDEDGDLDVELDLKGTTWRSLKTGVDVKDKAEGKIKMSGKVDMDGMKVDLTLTGPVTIDATTQLKAAKKE